MKSVRDLIGVPQGSKLILVLHSKDRFVEQLWTSQHNVLAAIASAGFYAVVSPDFSVMGDEPRMEHLLNMRRALLFFQQLERFGIPAIPHVFWGTERDLRRQINWVAANENVSFVALNVQLAHSRDLWQDSLRGLQLMESAAGREVHFLLCGVNGPRKIVEAKRALRHVSFIGSLPYLCCMQRRLMVRDGERFTRVPKRRTSPRKLFAANLKVLATVSGDPLRVSAPRHASTGEYQGELFPS